MNKVRIFFFIFLSCLPVVCMADTASLSFDHEVNEQLTAMKHSGAATDVYVALLKKIINRTELTDAAYEVLYKQVVLQAHQEKSSNEKTTSSALLSTLYDAVVVEEQRLDKHLREAILKNDVEEMVRLQKAQQRAIQLRTYIAQQLQQTLWSGIQRKERHLPWYRRWEIMVPTVIAAVAIALGVGWTVQRKEEPSRSIRRDDDSPLQPAQDEENVPEEPVIPPERQEENPDISQPMESEHRQLVPIERTLIPSDFEGQEMDVGTQVVLMAGFRQEKFKKLGIGDTETLAVMTETVTQLQQQNISDQEKIASLKDFFASTFGAFIPHKFLQRLVPAMPGQHVDDILKNLLSERLALNQIVPFNRVEQKLPLFKADDRKSLSGFVQELRGKENVAEKVVRLKNENPDFSEFDKNVLDLVVAYEGALQDGTDPDEYNLGAGETKATYGRIKMLYEDLFGLEPVVAFEELKRRYTEKIEKQPVGGGWGSRPSVTEKPGRMPMGPGHVLGGKKEQLSPEQIRERRLKAFAARRQKK